MLDKEVVLGSENGIVGGKETLSIAEVKKQAVLKEWQREIEERQSGEYSIEEWCGMKGIGKSSYYYRLRRVREYLCKAAGVLAEAECRSEKQKIVSLNELQKGRNFERKESRTEVSGNGINVTFNGEPEAELLRTVLETLRSC